VIVLIQAAQGLVALGLCTVQAALALLVKILVKVRFASSGAQVVHSRAPILVTFKE
jgi:hypothetical protein